jgi:hypothetical protein
VAWLCVGAQSAPGEAVDGAAARIKQVQERQARLEAERTPSSRNVYGMASTTIARCGNATTTPLCHAAREVVRLYDLSTAASKRYTNLLVRELSGNSPPAKGWVSEAFNVAGDIFDTESAAEKAADEYRSAPEINESRPVARTRKPSRDSPAIQPPPHRSEKRPPSMSDAQPNLQTPESTRAVVRDTGCPIAAKRLIKRMWACGLNAEGFTEEDLCASIDSATIRYVSNIETCNEILTRLRLK